MRCVDLDAGQGACEQMPRFIDLGDGIALDAAARERPAEIEAPHLSCWFQGRFWIGEPVRRDRDGWFRAPLAGQAVTEHVVRGGSSAHT